MACSACGAPTYRKFRVGTGRRAQGFCNEREASAYAVKFNGPAVEAVEVDDAGDVIERKPAGPAPWAE